VTVVTLRNDGSRPRIERHVRRVRVPAGTARGRFPLDGGQWAVRDGRWLSAPLPHEEIPAR
jgi:hypothetical protein